MLKSADDVGNLVVALKAHQPVYLKNVATITDGPAEIEKVHRIGAGPAFTGTRLPAIENAAVTIALAKGAGTNAVHVADNVVRALDTLRGKVIPDTVQINVTRNDGQRANDAVNTLMEHLAIAIGTVVLLLVVFLRWRAASIVPSRFR